MRRRKAGAPRRYSPATLTDAELLDDALPPERLLYRLFHSEGVATDRARALSYGCRCSRARLVGILEGFPPDDLDHMAVDGDIVMTCEFCNYDFRFPAAGRARPRCARHADTPSVIAAAAGCLPAAAASEHGLSAAALQLSDAAATERRGDADRAALRAVRRPAGCQPARSGSAGAGSARHGTRIGCRRSARRSGGVRHPGCFADTARRHDQRQLRGATRHLQHADHSRRLRPGKRVIGTYTGDLDDLPGRLYDMTKTMMDRMNVEFEYQVRRSLGSWLLAAGAVQAPVEQQPLTQTPPGTEPQPDMPPQTMPPPPTPMPSPTP